jgi:hypothetical protein
MRAYLTMVAISACLLAPGACATTGGGDEGRSVTVEVRSSPAMSGPLNVWIRPTIGRETQLGDVLPDNRVTFDYELRRPGSYVLVAVGPTTPDDPHPMSRFAGSVVRASQRFTLGREATGVVWDLEGNLIRVH